jgi:hypothetical protein
MNRRSRPRSKTKASSLPGDSDQLRVMDRLHAYAYFLEGLLPVLDRPECATAFRNGVDRAGRYLREIAPVFARSDVYAQLLRVAAAGSSCRWMKPTAAHEAEQAASFQIHSSDPAADSCSAASRRSDAVRQSGLDRVLRSGAGVVARPRANSSAQLGSNQPSLVPNTA